MPRARLCAKRQRRLRGALGWAREARGWRRSGARPTPCLPSFRQRVLLLLSLLPFPLPLLASRRKSEQGHGLADARPRARPSSTGRKSCSGSRRSARSRPRRRIGRNVAPSDSKDRFRTRGALCSQTLSCVYYSFVSSDIHLIIAYLSTW